jgi:hypothetical protein
VAKFLRSRMSLLLPLGRALLVRGFFATNHKEEDRQQLKMLFCSEGILVCMCECS